MLKKCKRCNISKNEDCFVLYKGKRRSKCRNCDNECLKEYRNGEKKDKILALRREYDKKHSKEKKNEQIKRLYNLSIEEYKSILNNQNNKCAICKTSRVELDKDLAVDHCHKTKKVRGLLCFNCNFGLGMFKDNENYLEEAVKYIKKNK